jgi:hypothetical protein
VKEYEKIYGNGVAKKKYQLQLGESAVVTKKLDSFERGLPKVPSDAESLTLSASSEC